MFGIDPSHRWPILSVLGFSCLSVWWLHTGWTPGGVGGGFHPGHVWAADQVAEMVAGNESWTGVTQRVGFPEATQLRLIAWVPLLLAVPFGWLVGVPASLWFMIVLGVFFTCVVTMSLIRRVLDVDPWCAAGASLVYAFSPFALGVLANGQLAKMQLWCLPLLLLFADRVLRDESKKWPAIWLLLSSVVLGFNAPSIGLVMPIALVIWVLCRTPSWTLARWAFVALGLAAIGMLPAWWMHTAASDLTVGLLPAAPVPGLKSPPHLSPVATPWGLLGVGSFWDGGHAAINNIGALSWPALLGCGMALVLSTRKALLGLSLVLGGVLLALGPSLDAGGFTWLLPAEILDRFGYPLQESGMYYRFVQVGSLGLAMCCCAAASHWPRRARWVALAFGLSAAADAVRLTSNVWPRSIRAISHQSIYSSMAADKVSGAVLELPLDHIDTEGERRLVGQLIHRRPTTVLARNMVVRGQPRLERLDAAVRGQSPQQELRQLGVRYVLLHRYRSHSQLYRRLVDSLGAPQEDGGLAAWVVSQ